MTTRRAFLRSWRLAAVRLGAPAKIKMWIALGSRMESGSRARHLSCDREGGGRKGGSERESIGYVIVVRTSLVPCDRRACLTPGLPS